MRDRNVPAAPLFQELDYHSFGCYGWVSMLMPAATPATSVARVAADAARVLRMPQAIARLDGLALVPAARRSSAAVRYDAKLAEKIITEAKITLQ